MRFYLLLSTAMVLLNNNPALATNVEVNLGTHAHLPLELKSTPHYDNSFKVAAICALGDDTCGLNSGFDKGNNDQNSGAQKCRDKGYSITRSCTAPKKQGAKCPYHPNYSKPCLCPANYTYTTANCPEPKIRGGGECDGKAVTCSCPATVSLTASDICNQKCDGNCTTKSSCPSGYIPNSAKDRCLNNNPPSGAAFTPCSSCQVQNSTGVTEAGNNYYYCRAKACNDYAGYTSVVPTDNKCSSANLCGNTCFNNCYRPACTEGGFQPSIPNNNVCTQTQFYSQNCYKDCRQPTCAEGGYLASKPSGQNCSSINYYGRTCYNNCKNACVSGGSSSCYGQKTACNSLYETTSSTCKDCEGVTKYSCADKVCKSSGGNSYFKGKACSYWSGYTPAKCASYYDKMGSQCYNQGLIGQGECDVMSWRSCCEECIDL